MKCDFVVGQKVVCINDNWPDVVYRGVVFPPRVPMINEVLTISVMETAMDGGPGVFLVFEEIERWQTSGPVTASVAYSFTHFRPLTTRKTDISIFKKMLTPAGRIPVDA